MSQGIGFFTFTRSGGGKIAFSAETKSYFRRHPESKAAAFCQTTAFNREIATVAATVGQL